MILRFISLQVIVSLILAWGGGQPPVSHASEDFGTQPPPPMLSWGGSQPPPSLASFGGGSQPPPPIIFFGGQPPPLIYALFLLNH